jgi:hypothetical protein
MDLFRWARWGRANGNGAHAAKPEVAEPVAGDYNGLFGPTDTAAETIPNRTPLTTFFNPGLFQRDYDGANTDEMATIFHEGLHGFTGKTDSELQLALGCQQQVGSINITDYLLQFLVVPPRTPIQACQ